MHDNVGRREGRRAIASVNVTWKCMPIWMKRPDAGFDLVTKLALVFVGAAVITLAIAAVAWLNFQQIASAQRAIIDDALPAMDAAQAVAHFNLAMRGRIEQLADAQSPAAIERRQRELNSAFVTLRRLVDQLADQRFDKNLRGNLATALDALDALRTELAQTAVRALAVGALADDAFSTQRKALAALEESAETLAAGASTATTATITGLYVVPAAEGRAPVMLDTLDRLVEQDIDRMERTDELQRVTLTYASALERLALENDPAALPALHGQAGAALEVIERRVEGIADAEQQLRTGRHVRQLVSALRDDGVFALRQQQLELSQRISAQRDSAHRLAARMNTQAGALIDAASRSIEAASRESRGAINRGMFGFLGAAALLALGMAAVLWHVFRNHVQYRVAAMTSSVHGLTAGQYDVPISVDASGPLAPLGEALEHFRLAQLRRQRESEPPAY